MAREPALQQPRPHRGDAGLGTRQSDDGGSRVTGYEYRVFGPCASGADAICDIVAPTRVSGTSRRITGLNREGMYDFQVRALNAVGASDWSQGVQKEVGPPTAGGGRVILSPSRLTVAEGRTATYRVKLSRSPTLPVAVVLALDGRRQREPEGPCLPAPAVQGAAAHRLRYWQARGHMKRALNFLTGWDWHTDTAYAWNVGVPITVDVRRGRRQPGKRQA